MKMMEKIHGLKSELRVANEYAEKTRDTWDQLKREKMHHKKQYHRVLSEKKMLN